jgi:hypothetical protein
MAENRTVKRAAGSGHQGRTTSKVTPTVADAVATLLDIIRNPLSGVGELAGWVDWIRADLAERKVLDGLSSEQQQELAQLVIELTKTADVVPWTRPLAREGKRWAKHGRGYIRELTRKTKAAKTALEDVRRYLTKIGFDTTPPYLKKMGFQTSRHAVYDTLITAIAALDPAAVQLMGERLISRQKSNQPTAEAALTLADASHVLTAFLVNECNLGKYEADRRTALIGKTYWDWNVAINNEWTQGAPGAPGSSAIRKRRARRLRRDTSRKPR